MSGSGRLALPDVRKWSGVPPGCSGASPGCLGVVGWPSRLFGRCRESLPNVREWWEPLPVVREWWEAFPDVQKWSGCLPGCLGVVGKLS